MDFCDQRLEAKRQREYACSGKHFVIQKLYSKFFGEF